MAESDIDITSFGFQTFDSLDRSYQLLISIGGDGTILRAITYVKDLEIPIVGINTGRLGVFSNHPNKQYRKCHESNFSRTVSNFRKESIELNNR